MKHYINPHRLKLQYLVSCTLSNIAQRHEKVVSNVFEQQ